MISSGGNASGLAATLCTGTVNFMADRRSSAPNDAASWSDFDADGYWKSNYASVLAEDAQIIRHASNFLIDACEGRPPIRRGLDVGTGTNLYPALLMIPWTERITFAEYSTANIDWLNDNLANVEGEWVWQPFWDLVAHLSGYRNVEQARRHLATGYDIRRLSIFDLPKRAWGLGSMYFVADRITSDDAEFESAVRSFLDALTPGAPFTMAFMEGSASYDVSGVRFPTVEITSESLDMLLGRLPVIGTGVLRTDNSVRRLRPAYDGMLLVTGYVMDDGPEQ
jgi:NNMT/PNMT/TEMT family